MIFVAVELNKACFILKRFRCFVDDTDPDPHCNGYEIDINFFSVRGASREKQMKREGNIRKL